MPVRLDVRFHLRKTAHGDGLEGVDEPKRSSARAAPAPKLIGTRIASLGFRKHMWPPQAQIGLVRHQHRDDTDPEYSS